MKIVLETGPNGCIQTAARRAQMRLVDELLSLEREPTTDEADLVEMLVKFLSESDFPKLRASSAALAGSVAARVELSRCADGSFSLQELEA